MALGYVTFITSIKGVKERDDLGEHLRKKIAPKFDLNSNIKCRETFRFDKIESLHFCSMLVLNGVDETDPGCFVFEATFDGSRDDFLEDLFRAAPDGIDGIYKHCVDYPESAIFMAELVKEYLIEHDAGANTFYSGSPGRSVAQIKGEKQIRDEILSFIQRRRPTATLPTTFRGLQCELQQEVIRKKPTNRWAEQPAEVPWEVAQSSSIAASVKCLAFAAACIVGAIALMIWGYGFTDLYQLFRDWSTRSMVPADSAEHFGLHSLSEVLNFTRVWMEPFAEIINRLRLPYHMVFIVFIGAWYLLRVGELGLLQIDDPRSYGFHKRFLAQLLSMLRFMLVIPLVGFGMLLVAGEQTTAPWLSVVQVIILYLIWLGLRYLETTLKLRTQFQKLKTRDETVRSFWLDIIRFCMLLTVVWAGLIIGRHLPDSVRELLQGLAPYVLTVAVYGLIGASIAYVFVYGLFLLIRLLEYSERRHFVSGSELVTKVDTPRSAYEREEGGVNKYQNHLASLTYVKPGIIRACSLRLTLFLIGLLARFWFNRGQLGDIPTILAARWVIIRGSEGERERLLFLTNYGGALDSYLNEFIDMAGVRGLNAVWTNTFVNFWSNASDAPVVKPASSKLGYAFPETKFYFWRGAETEKPFKAYVRQSQIETIVWYSAYPTFTTANINANTDLRQALFKPLAPCELDSILLKAGL